MKTFFTCISMKSKIKSEIKSELTDSQGRVYWIEQVPIDLLNYWDSPTQIPTRYDGGAADEYTLKMKNDQWDWDRVESFPVVFKEIRELEEGGASLGQRIDFWIGDGHHTIEAAEKAEKESLSCRIYLGSQLDAKLYSFREANRYHGVRLTNVQKREIVQETLRDRSILSRICEGVSGSRSDDVPSERLIAMYLGDVTSAPTVGAIWDQMVEQGKGETHPWLKTEKRLGQDGKRQIKRTKKLSQGAIAPPESAIVPEMSKSVEPILPIVEMAVSIEAESIEPQGLDEMAPPIAETAESMASPDEARDGFECVTTAEIKDVAKEHSEQIAQLIAETYAIDDLNHLQTNIYRSIAKTLTDYREEVQSKL
jgi:hypothetical protein